VTGVSGATLTVERAQEGTSAQNWNIGDLAYSNGSSGTFAPITAVHSPVESETLPTANKMIVTPGALTADITLTLPASPVVGQEYIIFGSSAAYIVTVQTSVTSGTPFIGLPDESIVYSWVISGESSMAGIVCVWDGTNWRGRTFGTTVVSDATANNEAVALGQLTNSSISPAFDKITATGKANIEGSIAGVTSGYSNTGLTIGWNYTNDQGEVDLLLGPQEGTGGLNIYQLNSSGDMPSSPAFSLTNTGALTLTGTATFAAGTSGNEGVNYTQLTNGSISPTFGNTVVADATSSNEAVNLGQLETLGIVTNGPVAYSASTTLTSANQGQLIFYTGSAAGTFTLPASNSVPGYQCKMVISNQSGYPLTIVPPSGDGCDLSPNVLQPNQYCCVGNDGGTDWHTFWNTAGSASPFVVANAAASNEAVALGQAFTYLSPTASETVTPTSLTTVVNPQVSSASTITLEPGTVAGQKVLIYSNGNYVITVSSNVTSGAPSFVMPDDSNIYSFDLPVNWGAFIEGVWDGTNWRCVTGGPTVVADATANNQAVALGQVLAVSPAYNQHDFTPASGGTYTISNSFTAPCNGYILAASTINVGGTQPVVCTNSISINGTNYGEDITTGPMTDWGAAAVSSGTACTVTSTYTAGSSSGTFISVSQTVMSIFIPNP
jgi:hypothetical protein